MLSGVLYFVGFAGFGVVPLVFVAWVPVLGAVQRGSARRALLIGWVFGLAAHMGGYYWVIHLLREFAGLVTPLAFLGFILLCLFQGASLALVIALVNLGQRRLKIAPVWSLPVALAAVEFAYPFIFVSYTGNALYNVPILTQVVELTGLLGLAVLIGLVNGAFLECSQAFSVRRRVNWARIAVPFGVLGLVALYGSIRIPMVERQIQQAPTMRVGLIQTNLGARDKAEQRSEFIRRHQTMSRALLHKEPELDLIVWPESAFNAWIDRRTTNLKREVTEGIDAPVLFGALTFDSRSTGRRIYNRAVLTSSTGEVAGVFDKVELLVFGETIPLVDTFPAIRKWFPRSGTFSKGQSLAHFRLGDTSLLPMICYEDILPGFVRAMWRADGPAELLVNVTNDSWYGDTHEPLIHLALASFRSIETRRALIRATNTGISAIVDPVGRIVSRTGQWTQETLVADVPKMTSGQETFYMKAGDLVGWLSVVLLGLAGLWARVRGAGRVGSEETRVDS